MAEDEKQEQTEQAEQPEQPEQPEAEGAEQQATEAEETPEEGAEAGQEALEGLDWKARRRLLRSRESGLAVPQRSSEERAAERAAQGRAAAGQRRRYRAQRRQGRERREGTPPADRRSVARKVRQGTVVSSKPDKTITVRIDVARRHPAYEKIVRQSRTLRVHDEGNEAGEGDLVRVVETRPLSRTKRWRLVEILEKAK